MTGFFWLCICYAFCKTFFLPKKFYSTRNGIALCLLCLCVPGIYMLTTSKLDLPLPTKYSILCGGLVASLLTSDIIVAKMCNRQLHPLIPSIFMVSLIGDSYAMLVAAFYYISTFSELCDCFNVSLFSSFDDRTVVFVGKYNKQKSYL